MDSRGIFLIGAGGHSKQVIDIFLENNQKILGVFDDKKVPPVYRDIKLLGKLDDIPKVIQEMDLSSEHYKPLFFCTIGDNQRRKEIVEKVRDVTWVNCISKHSFVSPTVKMGIGNYIGTFAKILGDSTIGDFNIINEGSTAAHDNKIGSFNHLAPSSALGGTVTLGDNNLIGTNATVNLTRKIGNNITIGSGAVVTKDILEPGTYVGVPATLLKK